MSSKVVDGRVYETLKTIQSLVAYRWLSKVDSILEIGCSIGYFADRLRQKAKDVYGVDINL